MNVSTNTESSGDQRRRMRRARIRTTLSVALLLAVAGSCLKLVDRHRIDFDLSASASNRLALASSSILAAVTERVRIRAYMGADSATTPAVKQLLDRYHKASDFISVEIIDPEQNPRLAREADVQQAIEIEVFLGDRREKITQPSESNISAALARLLRAGNLKIGVLRGHGERAISNENKTGIGIFAERAKSQGFDMIGLDLSTARRIPDNIDALLMLANTEAPLAFEVLAVQAYLARGGNLIWLFDPGERTGWDPIATSLGLELLQGLLVDPSSRINGRPTPEFIVVREFSSHPLVKGMSQSQVIFPTAASINWRNANGWTPKTLASSSFNSWLETGDLSAAVRFDDGVDTIGPLDIVVALERTQSDAKTQRAVVAADVDFASNAYIGLGANFELARRVLDWTTNQDASLTLEHVRAKDLEFNANTVQRAIIALGAPVVLPLLLCVAALTSWRRSRR